MRGMMRGWPHRQCRILRLRPLSLQQLVCARCKDALTNHKSQRTLMTRLRTRVLAETISPAAITAPSYTETLNLPQTTFPAHHSPKNERALNDHSVRLYEFASTRPSESPPFIIHDGPPYANGSLHMGHLMNKTLKDIIVRHAILTGKRVHYVPGWDCHGLPIELKALTAQQSSPTEGRTTLTPMEIRAAARAYAESAIANQKAEMQRWGVCADWDHPYTTMSAEYETAQLRVFASMFKDGLIHRALRPVYWSAHTRTALAEAELEYSDDHISPAVYVKFPFKHITDKAVAAGLTTDVAAVIWTTTPWTIPANQAIAYRSTFDYSIVETSKHEKLLIGNDRINALQTLLKEKLIIHSTFNGTILENCITQHPLFSEQESPLLAAHYVSVDSGTCLVHTAPAHGEDDYNLCIKYDIRHIRSVVDDDGRFNEQVGINEWIGKDILTDGNAAVIQRLQESQYLLHTHSLTHRYPYDWRSKTPVIQRATYQWFAKLDQLSQRALDALDQVKFVPAAGVTRLSAMVRTRKEWCISRQRCWGLPLPVFYNENNEPLINDETLSHIINVIQQHGGSDCWWTLPIETFLPNKYVNDGHTYRKGLDTLDVWFDSGVSWSAVIGNDHIADIYLEGSDQHRGWFQSSLLTSVAVTNHAPYRTVITHGFVMDETGRKMSKSLGNVIEPRTLIDGDVANSHIAIQPANGKSDMIKTDLKTIAAATSTTRAEKKAGKAKAASIATSAALSKVKPVGADVMRLWVASTDYVNDVSVGAVALSKVNDVYRKIRGSIKWMMGCLADFSANDRIPHNELFGIDRYMIEECRRFALAVDSAYQAYAYNRVYASLIHMATTDMSAFYFDVNKDRLYCDHTNGHSRRSCQTVLVILLETLLKAIAPILPHTAEDAYRHLTPQLRQLIKPEYHHASLVVHDIEDDVTITPLFDSVFTCGWMNIISSPMYTLSLNGQTLRSHDSLIALYTVARQIKSALTVVLADARNQQIIGNALDADVTVRMDSNTQLYRDCLDLADELELISLSSSLTVQSNDQRLSEVTDSSAVFRSTEVKDSLSISTPIEIVVRRSSASKCARCWKFVPRLNAIALCQRCSEVVGHIKNNTTQVNENLSIE